MFFALWFVHHVQVEYTNIIQIIKEIDVIVNEQCKQESREYQHVINKEENSRKVITEQVRVAVYSMIHFLINCVQYFSFMDTLVSTVDCANKQLLKDGIIANFYAINKMLLLNLRNH